MPLMWPKSQVSFSPKPFPRRVKDYDSRCEGGDYGASGGGICVAQDCFEFGAEVHVPEHYSIVILTEPR